MDYSLDEQEQEVAGLAATILGDLATTERLADLEAEGAAYDQRTWAELARAGLLGIAVPETQGGSGATFLELALVIEAAARVAAPLFLVESAVGAALTVSRFGTSEQHERLVTPYAAGECVLTSALARPSTAAPGFTARRVGSEWVVDGAAAHVPLAVDALRILVRATDEQGRPGLLLIDPAATGATLTPHASVDRQPRWRLDLREVRVDEHDVVLAPGESVTEQLTWFDAAITTARAVQQLGTADAALRMTASHASTREQFGRPIGSFQAVAHRVADAYIDVQGIRLTAWRAAWLLARDVVDTEAVAIAAWWAADAPTRVLETAMQVHGGVSVDLDYPLHRFFLAARQAGLALGGASRALTALGDQIAVA